ATTALPRSVPARDERAQPRPWRSLPELLIQKYGTFWNVSLFVRGSQAVPSGLRARRPDRAEHAVAGEGDEPSAAHHDSRSAPRGGGGGERARGRRRAAEEHGRPPRQGAHGGRSREGGADAPR